MLGGPEFRQGLEAEQGWKEIKSPIHPVAPQGTFGFGALEEGDQSSTLSWKTRSRGYKPSGMGWSMSLGGKSSHTVQDLEGQLVKE